MLLLHEAGGIEQQRTEVSEEVPNIWEETSSAVMNAATSGRARVKAYDMPGVGWLPMVFAAEKDNLLSQSFYTNL